MNNNHMLPTKGDTNCINATQVENKKDRD